MSAPGPVVFFGTPQFAVPCLEVLAESEFRPELVVSQPSRPAGRGRTLAMPPVATRASDLDLYVEQVARVRSAAFLERLEAMQPWIAVVVAFGQIFPKRLLEIPAEGCVNVHASLLPRFRGAAPIQAAIASGDSVTGVTTMRMEAGLDSGPILLEREVAIGSDDMLQDVAATLSRAGAELLLETLRALAAGALEANGQRESEVTWAPRLEKSDGFVDWGLPARVLYNRYRAFTPWPGLTAVFRGEPVKVLGCVPSDLDADLGADGAELGSDHGSDHGSDQRDPKSDEGVSASPPGTVLSRARRLRVVCGDGRILELLSLQRPGRKPQSGSEFANGERVEVGDRFEAP